MTADADDHNAAGAEPAVDAVHDVDAPVAPADTNPAGSNHSDDQHVTAETDDPASPHTTAEMPPPEVATAAATSTVANPGSPDDPAVRPHRRGLVTAAVAVGAFVVGGLVGGAIGHRAADREDGRSEAATQDQVRSDRQGAPNKGPNSDAGDAPRDQRGGRDHDREQGRPGGGDGQHRERRSQHD